MKKAIITGATSGIGHELAIQLAQKGYHVGLVGRRTDRLEQLAAEIGEHAFYRTLDVTDHETAALMYRGLAEEMGGLDLMILNAGIGNTKLIPAWESDHAILEVNVVAFAHGMHFAFNYFREQGHGHIVGMSSMAAHLSSGRAAAYTASKHFISNYMTSFRQKALVLKTNITITDIRPGFVVSEITENLKRLFWVAPTEKAVRQMVQAIEAKKKRVYITKKWYLLAIIARLVPEFIWDRIKA